MFSLQQILGHATLDMVRRYVRLSEADLVARHGRIAGHRMWMRSQALLPQVTAIDAGALSRAAPR